MRQLHEEPARSLASCEASKSHVMSYIELIERVKSRPEVWQHTHPLYKNKMVRLKFWHRLAKELEEDENQLKKNWKYLADQYRREYKKIAAQEKATGQTLSSGWAYYDALSFLKPGMAIKADKFGRPPMVTRSSESDKEATFQNDNDDSSHAKRVKKGSSDSSVSKADLILRKIDTLNSTIMQSQPDMLKSDEDCMFFMSILPMIKNLSPVKKLRLRGKINDWLLETLSEKDDPLKSVRQYVEVQEDNKEELRRQLMAAEEDD